MNKFNLNSVVLDDDNSGLSHPSLLESGFLMIQCRAWCVSFSKVAYGRHQENPDVLKPAYQLIWLILAIFWLKLVILSNFKQK